MQNNCLRCIIGISIEELIYQITLHLLDEFATSARGWLFIGKFKIETIPLEALKYTFLRMIKRIRAIKAIVDSALEGIIFVVMDYKIKVDIDMDIAPIASFNWGQDYATKLRRCRESAGLSRAKLSQMSGVAEGYIQQIENPKLLKRKQVTVGADTLAKICEALQ